LKNRVLRRIFGPKRDEVTGEWRKLHNEELMICTPHQILFGVMKLRMGWTGRLTHMEERRGFGGET